MSTLVVAAPDRDALSEPLRAARNALTLGSALALTSAMALAIRLLIPRFLGPAAFGELRLAESFAEMLFVILTFGVDMQLRREAAVDLRDDWPTTLRDNGFRPDEPSAWIAEGLLIYLTADAQAQLFTDLDALACAGSHAGIEEGIPMDRDAFRARRESAKDLPDHRGQWWQLIYNERHAPAAQWFSRHGWTAVETPLSDYLTTNGRATPADDAEERNMIDSVRLVGAVKN